MKPQYDLYRAPARRPLRAYAFDPSRGRRLGNEMQLNIRWRPVKPGPVDLTKTLDRIAVIDYDASNKKYYRPVDLDDPYILTNNGLAPSETDPRFHQQMVYAVASDTIEQFELALGRRTHWRRAERPKNADPGWLPEDILCLTLFPHAMHDANAFYSPDAHGILFGYFSASDAAVGLSVPGQTVFTCLSHDIIVHEMTHALLDGMRSHFMEQTNPDVAAFHEAFADLIALFRHFSHREVLLDTIQRSGGRLYTPALREDPLADRAGEASIDEGKDVNPLIELAAQFGEARGGSQGLRSAIGTPKSLQDLQQPMDPHERGSILVAAVFEAFFQVYLQRAARVFRIYRSAGGVNRDDLTQPLATALCDEATRTADEFFRMCVRSIDYLPPVDITFGDFLRAVMTSQLDYDLDDADNIRDAWMHAFRRREMLPDNLAFFSLDGLTLPAVPDDMFEVENLPFGGPLGLDPDERKKTAAALRAFIENTRGIKQRLCLDPKLDYTIPSFHPMYRTDINGSVRWDLVAEVVQTSPENSLRGGTTMIISTHGIRGSGETRFKFLRYANCKPLHGHEAARRIERQRTYFSQLGMDPYIAAGNPRINFALVHGGGY
jgi:hypothetical protein